MKNCKIKWEGKYSDALPLMKESHWICNYNSTDECYLQNATRKKESKRLNRIWNYRILSRWRIWMKILNKEKNCLLPNMTLLYRMRSSSSAHVYNELYHLSFLMRSNVILGLISLNCKLVLWILSWKRLYQMETWILWRKMWLYHWVNKWNKAKLTNWILAQIDIC